jgi:signal peptidase
MKTVWKKVSDILAIIVTVLALCAMVLTILSVTTVGRQSKSIFGFNLFIVTSDSMKATDFEAGDMIVIQKVDADTLEAGDIISYISENPDNYGKTITHKIREVQKDAQGNLKFVTYGTTSGVNDEVQVSEHNVLGIYRMRIPQAGKFFYFLKTTPGYILFVLLPFLALIIYNGFKAYFQFRKYRQSQMDEIQRQLQKLEEEKKSLLQMRMHNQEGEQDENQE